VHKTRNVRRKQWRRYRRNLTALSRHCGHVGMWSAGIKEPKGLHEEAWLRRGMKVPAWWKI